MKRFLLLLIVWLIMLPSSMLAEVKEVPADQLGAWVLTNEVLVPGTPEAAYDAFTGDISPWWDHSFSGDPAAFYIDARPGGGFYEWFDEDSQDGVLHATVITAIRGKLLRLDGPLGLSGRALNFVTTLAFEAVDDSTRLTAVVHCSGEIDSSLASIVDGVWWHFIGEQFKPWYEDGALGKKKMPLR